MNYSHASLLTSLALRFPGARPWLESHTAPSTEGPADAAQATSPMEPNLTHIARLEEKFAQQETQYRRAEETCAMLRAQKDPVDIKLLMQADAFANRLLQQQTRLLRELRLARKELEALTKELDEITRQASPQQDAAQQNYTPRSTALHNTIQGDSSQDILNSHGTYADSGTHASLSPAASLPEQITQKHGPEIDETPPEVHSDLVHRLVDEVNQIRAA